MKTSKYDSYNFRHEFNLLDILCRNDEFQMPIRYILYLTNECNLKCPFCFMQKTKKNERMNTDDWLNVLSQLPEYARVILMGGEPFYFDGFDAIYKYVASHFRCSVITNGTLLSEEKVELLLSGEKLYEVGVSIDTVSNQTREFTPEQWQTLVNGIRLFVKRKRELAHPARLNIKTVLLDETAHTLFDLHKFVHEELECDGCAYGTLAGTDIQNSDQICNFAFLYTQPDPPYLYKNWHIIIDQLHKIQEYDQQHNHKTYIRPKILDFPAGDSLEKLDVLNQPDFKKDIFAKCSVPFSDCRILGDGNVTPCLAIPFGNFKKAGNLKEILTGTIANNFKEELQRLKFFPQCCRCNYLYAQEYEYV